MKGNFAAIALVLVGSFWLLNNVGLIDVSLMEMAKKWWPLVLIGLGVAMFFQGRNDKKG